MSEAHARLSPSNLRWPKCPGSIREEERYPDIPGAAAIDGTGSHLLLEMCLLNGVPAAHYDGQIIGANHPDNPNGWLIDIERCQRVQMCLDYVARRYHELKKQFGPTAEVTIEAESKSDPGGMSGRDDWNGTCDITLIVTTPDVWRARYIEVIDYKDGQGWVDVINSTQLAAYLLGKMRPFIASGPELVRPIRPEGVENVRMTIVQPKTNPVIRYQDRDTPDHPLTPRDAVELFYELEHAARETDFEDAALVPGKHCRWCKANPKRGGHCTAANQQAFEKVNEMATEIATTGEGALFEQVSQMFANIAQLDNNQLADLADTKDAIMAGYLQVEKEIENRLNAGQEVPGYAYRPGRGSNVWNTSEENIVKMLKSRKFKKEDIYPPKLISPAQVMNSDKLTDVQKEKIQNEYISYKAGKDKLTKVERSSMSDKVAQADAPSVDSVELMFGSVANAAPTPADEPSFF